MKPEPPPAIRLPAGARDFLPLATARRRGIAERLLSGFETRGYERVITPLLECADVLERGLGEEGKAAAVRFVEPATGEVVALRTDITPQIARLAATRLGDVSGPIRLCYEGAVTRLDRRFGHGQRGQREILQAGVEIIDAPSPSGDAEAIAVAAEALATLDIAEVRLDVGHVALVRHGLGAVVDADRRDELRGLLASKDRAGVARVAASCGLSASVRAVLEALPTLYGLPDDVLAAARKLALPPACRRAVDSLEEVLSMSAGEAAAALRSQITVDLGEVRGFDYYTGVLFAGYAAGVGDAVLRGGRYDELVGRYGRSARATGFAVDIEAIAQAQRAGGVPPREAGEGVLIAPAGERGEATSIAAALRSRGYRAAVHLGNHRKRAELARYAVGVGFTRVLLLGRGDACVLSVDPAASRNPAADKPPRKLARETSVPGAAIRSAGDGDPDQLIRALGLERTPRTRRA